MAKLSLINREKKREALVEKFSAKRAKMKLQLQDTTLSEQEKFELRLKLQALPRNANPTRLRNRCALTGRPRGFFRRFGLCRNKIREIAMCGEIPGVTKASW
ncbi:MAG: 30S ribosomal protein S14 [Pseudomonadota bacterium]